MQNYRKTSHSVYDLKPNMNFERQTSRYATKMVLYDGLMIALIIGLAVLIAVL